MSTQHDLEKPRTQLVEELQAIRQHNHELQERLLQSERESEQRFWGLFEATFEAVLIHENGIFVDVNPAFERMFGYTAEELRGKSVMLVVAEESQPEIEARIREKAETPTEFISVARDGRRFYTEVTTRNQSQQGRSVRVVVLRDITHRKTVEIAEREEHAFSDALRRTSEALNRSLDPNEVMQNILENVGRVVPHDAVNIMRIENNAGYYTHWRGYPPSFNKFFTEFTMPIDSVANLRQIAETRQPFVIPDTDEYPDWVHVEETNWVKSFASAPIILDDQIIGVINLDSGTRHALTETHAQRLQAFAEQAAIAIKNARLYEQSRQQTGELARRNLLLEMLNDLSRTAIDTLEPGYIMDMVAKLSASAVDATSAYVCDWNTDNDTSTVLAEYISAEAAAQEHHTDVRRTYHISEEFDQHTGWINSADHYIIQWADDPNLNAHKRSHMQEHGAKIGLIVPLWVNDAPLGYIEIWDSRKRENFTKEEIEIIQAIARQIASTIEKSRLHNALLENELQLRAMLDAIPDRIFRLSRDGYYVDSHAPEGSSFSKEEIIGKHLKDFMPPEVAARAKYYISRTLESGQMQIYEYQLRGADGGDYDYEARLVVSGQDEVLAIVRDVTERKRTERDLAQARDQALEASRTKSRFLANMSHELRTPLNSIINYTQLTVDGIYGELNRAQQDRLDRVLRNGKNLLAIINDVLDLSKIEAGQLMLKRARVDPRELINGVVESLRPLATQKRLELNFNPDGTLPDLWVDEGRARQIFTNIIGNAVKFTSEGSVSVQVQPADERFLRISVIDTGIGIPKDALEAIFDEFHQVDNSSTREYEGTGLGLTISRRLANMHGGQLTAESELGKGSTFHIYLPIAREG